MENPISRFEGQYSTSRVASENARYMSSVYGWMTLGIAISGAVAWQIGQSPDLAMAVVNNRLLFWGMVIAQFGAVIYLTARIQQMSAFTATSVYLLYTVLTGVTLSVIFMIYTHESIAQVFGLTAFAFAGLSIFGLVTKRDLGPVGSFCMMGLFGMIGFAFISMIFPSVMGEVASKTYSLVGVVVFAGLTAYDTQKIKAMNPMGGAGSEADRKGAIHGALSLYLDFINMFLSIMRLMGRRR